jgi:LPS O-antigen subunit length determinant protein (WzzB/FepE family)
MNGKCYFRATQYIATLKQDPPLRTSPISEQKSSTTDDHISYGGIRDMFAQLFHFLVRFLDFLNALLFRNKWMLLGGLIAGLALGYLYYYSKKNVYKVSMIVEFTELNKRTYAEIFSQLNTLILSASHQQLANELQIPLPVAKNVDFIETFNINNEPLHKDTSTRINQPFKIVVSVKNIQSSDTLQKAIVRYLNNNPFLTGLKTSQKKIQEHKLLFIDSELKKLDSLKSEYNRFLSSTQHNPTFYNNAINPAEIYIQSEQLMKEREKTVRWLDVNSLPINVITGFMTPVKPTSSSLQLLLLIFGLSGFLLAFVIAFFRELKRTLIG